MTSRYVEDIRKIAKTKELTEALERAEAKAPIIPKRGISYLSSSAKLGSTTGTPVLEDTSGDITEDGDKPQPDEDTSGLTDEVTDEDIKDNTTDSFTGKDIIDGDAGPEITGDNLGAGIDINTGQMTNLNTLSELSVTDPDTGYGVLIRLDGLGFPPPAYAAEYNGSGSWIDGEIAAVLYGYAHGFYWEASFGSNQKDMTVNTLSEKMVTEYRATAPASDDYEWVRNELVTETFAKVYLRQIVSGGVPITPGSEFALQMNRWTCTTTTSYCPVVAPTEEYWQAVSGSGLQTQEQYSLKYVLGQFNTSPFDLEAPLKYTHGEQSRIDFKFDGATRFGAVEAGPDGGYMIYETNAVGNDPTSDIKIYRQNGTLSTIAPSAAYSLVKPQN